MKDVDMLFSFQRIMSGGYKWTDNLLFDDKPIGVLGHDEEGLFIRLKRDLSLSEINMLIAQISLTNTNILEKKIEFQKYEK